MVTEPDETTPGPDPALVAALESARDRSPWTVSAVREHAERPAEGKATWETCEGCPAPCEADEVCATVIVHELGLLERFGRAQAFRLVEGGVRRLRLKEVAEARHGGEHRPNRFVKLVGTDRADE